MISDQTRRCETATEQLEIKITMCGEASPWESVSQTSSRNKVESHPRKYHRLTKHLMEWK